MSQASEEQSGSVTTPGNSNSPVPGCNTQDDDEIAWIWRKEDLPFKSSDEIPALSSKMLDKGIADEPVLYFQEIFTEQNIEIILIDIISQMFSLPLLHAYYRYFWNP